MWRLLHHWWAELLGYFWLPCLLCGRMFGGHEKSGMLYLGYGKGQCVCWDCREDARRISQERLSREVYTESGVMFREDWEAEERLRGGGMPEPAVRKYTAEKARLYLDIAGQHRGH